jgi:lipopolysaccharide/colanic/teichoic acid biosynthesis glycosyltransferase
MGRCQAHLLPPAGGGLMMTISADLRIERLADLLLASSVVMFTLPFAVLVCLAIKLDSSGPIFSRQLQLAADGRSFYRLKFRTTFHDPNPASSRLIWNGEARRTRVGAFLWLTRIQDFPQLINMLRGEMTLIGSAAPRPDLLD